MLTVLIRYKGTNGSARRFVEEMISSGIVAQIRKEEGNPAMNTSSLTKKMKQYF